MKINMSVLVLLASTPNTTSKARAPETYTEAEVASFAAKKYLASHLFQLQRG